MRNFKSLRYSAANDGYDLVIAFFVLIGYDCYKSVNTAYEQGGVCHFFRQNEFF